MKGDPNAIPLRGMLDGVFQAIKDTSYFCCCFSPLGDQLPMWRSYSELGDGLSIGFRPRALFDLHGRFNKVDYFPEADSDMAKDLKLKKVISEILDRAKNYRVEMSIEQRLAFATQIIARCTSIKHASWEYEQEVRCLYSQSNSPGLLNGRIVPTVFHADGSGLGPFEIKSRESRSSRVNYLDFNYGKMRNKEFDAAGAIAKIFVGPKSSLSVPDVRAIMNSEGFVDFEVVQSECSWR